MNLEKMPLGKRGYSGSYSARAKRARMTGSMTRGIRAVTSRKLRGRTYTGFAPLKSVVSRVNNLYKMIETKEMTYKSSSNVALSHNNVTVVNNSNGNPLNPFESARLAGDPMAANTGERVGDQISVKGLMIKGFVENALARPKVYYRIMLLKGAKGETFSRANIFKDSVDNKMIDQINTERFTIVAQKIFNATASNVAASGAEAANGAPIIAQAGGIGSRTFKMWIPGAKFGRNGTIQYENGSNTQVKFFDYRLVIVVYDWYGTPQDINTVGRINQLYTKVYFKDA